MAPTPASPRVNLAESRVFDGLSAVDRRAWLDAATIRDVSDTVIDGVALASVWSVPPLLFAFDADAQALLGLWIVLSVLLASASFAMAALPLAMAAR